MPLGEAIDSIEVINRLVAIRYNFQLEVATEARSPKQKFELTTKLFLLGNLSVEDE